MLKEEKSFLLILDNVWDGINLDDVGVPQPVVPARSKVIIATRSLEVCRQMRTDIEENVTTLKEVYKVIQWSFDSLESLDIQSCFLYCSLYPAVIPTDDLIHCWWTEGFLGEHDTYEEAYNGGIKMVEDLKDACLLEVDKKDFLEIQNVDCFKMHDVVRDVAIWIDNSSGNEHKSIIQIGIGLTTISHIKVSAFVKTISFISNEIECLPDCFTKCPETTSLLMQDNEFLEEIPHEFFLAFPALRVLNLSETGIGVLSSSINSLCQLRALILQSCHWLKELPPVGNLCNLQVLDCDDTMLR
ncbi:hypothetical protein BC332_13871 [Capsicum chinense]|nr:hypothetical protein BC332_13871 [Capsicum chinense]